jgi:NTP pyrophosphatase (non-canonical NTP hydrolase)
VDFNEYQKIAMSTAKPWADNETNLRLAYYGLGLTGESGECADAIKKHLSGSKPIDPDEIKRELGDVLWYVNALAAYFNFELDDIAKTNVAKLKARHGDSWSGYGNRAGDGR